MSFFVFIYNKKYTIFFLLLSVIFLFWHDYQLTDYLKKQLIIPQSKHFKGMIIDKKINGKRYSYLLSLYELENQNKKIRINGELRIISNQNIPIGSFVSIPYIYFLETAISKEAIIAHPYYLSVNAIGLTYRIFVSDNFRYQIIYSFVNYLFALKENFYHFYQHHFGKKYAFFFDTIFLGRPCQETEYRNLFSLWGISHYLARSGLHIQICINILISFFLFLGFSYTISAILQLFFLLFFYFFTFPSISFFRAFIMFFLFLMCKMFRLPTTSLHALSMTTIITFLMYPFCFLKLGVQLTFFTTFILAFKSYIKQIKNKKATR